MNCKFTLTCKKCGCAMQLMPSEGNRLPSVVCQNCGQKLNEVEYNRLKSAMTSISDLPYESVDGCYSAPHEGFKFEIEISPSPHIDLEY